MENAYLPPSSARFAGGSGSVLAAPSVGLSTPLAHAAPGIGSIASPGLSAGFAGSVGAAPIPSVSYGVPVAAVKAYAAPVTPILRLNNDNNGEGSYRYE